tara:strand:+ start:397832 stop:398230 length:399 start_codon:yes stop_codon:yes gene_type:complete
MRKLTYNYLMLLLIFGLFLSHTGHAQIEGTVKIETSESVKRLVAQKLAFNKQLEYIDGFKIQLFYGSEKSAMDVREKFSTVFPDVKSELKFQSPDWKVWVGSYKSKIEADRALEEIKEGFPSAIIRAAKVKI